MQFYNIWKTKGGFVGVNQVSLTGLVNIQFQILIMYVIIIAVLGIFIPTLFFGFYIIFMLFTNNELIWLKDKKLANILAIISSIYFLIDYHYGFMSFSIVGSIIQADTYEKIAVFNLTIGLMSLASFFSNEIINDLARNRLLRLMTFIAFIYFSYKVTHRISSFILKHIITQCVDKSVTESRLQKHIYNMEHTDEKRKKRNEIRHKKELEKIEELKRFDENLSTFFPK